MTDKQIIVTFSDGYCIVLEDNEATIRENDFTKYRIVVGDRTNELLNFVKELYLSHKFKEQECEELKKIINEAKNSKLDLKSFLVGEAIQNEYEQKLDQLKAENKELKQYKSLFEKARNLWDEARMNNYKFLAEIEDLKDSLKRTICQSECYRYKEAEKLKQTLTEIKELLLKTPTDSQIHCVNAKSVILQKISEVEDV